MARTMGFKKKMKTDQLTHISDVGNGNGQFPCWWRQHFATCMRNLAQTFDVNRPNKMDPKFKSNIGDNLLQLLVFKCVIVFQNSVPLSTLSLCVGTQTACPADSLENKHAVQTFLLQLCTRSKKPVGNWMDWKVSQAFLVVILTYWGGLLLQLCRKSLYMYKQQTRYWFSKDCNIFS